MESKFDTWISFRQKIYIKFIYVWIDGYICNTTETRTTTNKNVQFKWVKPHIQHMLNLTKIRMKFVVRLLQLMGFSEQSPCTRPLHFLLSAIQFAGILIANHVCFCRRIMKHFTNSLLVLNNRILEKCAAFNDFALRVFQFIEIFGAWADWYSSLPPAVCINVAKQIYWVESQRELIG